MINIHETEATGVKLYLEAHSADAKWQRGGRRLILAGVSFLIPVQPPFPTSHHLLVSSVPPVAAGTLRRNQTGCHTTRNFFLAAADETEKQALSLDGLTSPDESFDESIGDFVERELSGDCPDNTSPKPTPRRGLQMIMSLPLLRRLAGRQILEENDSMSLSDRDAARGNLKNNLVEGGKTDNGPGFLSKLRARLRQHRRRRLLTDARSTEAKTSAVNIPKGGAEGDTVEEYASGDNAHPSIDESLPGEGITNRGVVAKNPDGIVDDAGSALEDPGSEKQRGVKEPLNKSCAARPKMYDDEEVSPETWNKVDELRRRAETCDPNSEETRGLHLWLTGGGESRGLTDVDLLRFIMFRHGNVEDAWQQLKLAAAWRLGQRVEDILFENNWTKFKELQEEIFWLGRDKRGRPTMVLRSIAHLPGRIESEEFERYLLYLMEQGRQLWGVGAVEQMNIIVDRVGAGLKNQDPRLLSSMLPVFRDAYPDIIYRCYIAPTSWIFRLVWAIGARLVDDRQRKRVLLLLHKWQSRLLEDFDAGILPEHLGGTMKEYPPPQPINEDSKSSKHKDDAAFS